MIPKEAGPFPDERYPDLERWVSPQGYKVASVQLPELKDMETISVPMTDLWIGFYLPKGSKVTFFEL